MVKIVGKVDLPEPKVKRPRVKKTEKVNTSKNKVLTDKPVPHSNEALKIANRANRAYTVAYIDAGTRKKTKTTVGSLSVARQIARGFRKEGLFISLSNINGIPLTL